jgi:hypothetical protein
VRGFRDIDAFDGAAVGQRVGTAFEYRELVERGSALRMFSNCGLRLGCWAARRRRSWISVRSAGRYGSSLCAPPMYIAFDVLRARAARRAPAAAEAPPRDLRGRLRLGNGGEASRTRSS